jgi:hypothetical protein
VSNIETHELLSARPKAVAGWGRGNLVATEHLSEFDVVCARGNIVRIRKMWKSFSDEPDSDVQYAAITGVNVLSIEARSDGRFLLNGVLFERRHPHAYQIGCCMEENSANEWAE